MPSSAWRLLSLSIVVLAFLLAGAPEFPALERAVANAFRSAAEIRVPDTPAPDVRGAGTSVPAATTARERGILVPLYISFAALQALDAHATLRALDAGATEMNPLMGGLAGKPAALLAMKAGLAASTIYFVEKLRLRSRAAAIVLMMALDSAYATIVAHNYAATP
jgi:hypothetical protein